MPGRKPDYRLMFVEDNGKGKKVWHRVGAAWKNDNGSIGVEVNAGLPVVFQSHTKLVLVENENEEQPQG
jgi:hypothetical protein